MSYHLFRLCNGEDVWEAVERFLYRHQQPVTEANQAASHWCHSGLNLDMLEAKECWWKRRLKRITQRSEIWRIESTSCLTSVPYNTEGMQWLLRIQLCQINTESQMVAQKEYFGALLVLYNGSTWHCIYRWWWIWENSKSQSFSLSSSCRGWSWLSGLSSWNCFQ